MKSINARSRACKDVTAFPKWYIKRLNVRLRLDVGPGDFSVFRGDMGRTFVLACQTSPKLRIPDRWYYPARATRPVSLIQRDLQSRKSGSPNGAVSKQVGKSTGRGTKSPRAIRTIHIANGDVVSFIDCDHTSGHPPVRNHTDVGVNNISKRGYLKSLLD